MKKNSCLKAVRAESSLLFAMEERRENGMEVLVMLVVMEAASRMEQNRVEEAKWKNGMR